jgi:hypothetical protein
VEPGRFGQRGSDRAGGRGRLPARCAARRLPLLLPFQYRIHSQSLVTIPQGQIGYIFARDGAPLGPTQTLASNAATADFLDVRAS